MKETAVQALVNRLTEFVEFYLARHPTPEPPPKLPSHIFEAGATFSQEDIDHTHFNDGETYLDFPTLMGPEVEMFNTLVSNWSKRREFPGTSIRGITKSLSNLIVDCLNGPSKTSDFTRKLIEDLQLQPIVDIYLPVSGIDMRVDEWQLSADICLVRMTPERFENDIVSSYVRAAEAEAPRTDYEARGLSMARMLNSMIGMPVLRIRANGDEYNAQQAAEDRAQLAVDALQFCAAVFHPGEWRVVIDWAGNIPASQWWGFGQVPVQGVVHPNNPAFRRGMLAPWVLDSTIFEKIKEQKVDAVVNVTLALEEAEHLKMISRSVQAFANGERHRSTDDKKLNYVTVLDIFYSNRDTGDTTRQIREGVAFTLFNRTSIEKRFKQAQFINFVYDSRSRTSHDYELGLDVDDLKLLRQIACNFIGLMSLKPSFTKLSLIAELEAERVAMGKDYDRFFNLGRESNAPDAQNPPASAD